MFQFKNNTLTKMEQHKFHIDVPKLSSTNFLCFDLIFHMVGSMEVQETVPHNVLASSIQVSFPTKLMPLP